MDLTKEEMAAVEKVETAEQWKAFTEAVKDARGGRYPDDWYRMILQSGLADRILARFGASSELKVTTVQRLAPSGGITEKLSKETQRKLCEEHIKHFTLMLEHAVATGDDTINVFETKRYQEIWINGLKALDAGQGVAADCAGEMYDAVSSGDYEYVLKPEELEHFKNEEAAEHAD